MNFIKEENSKWDMEKKMIVEKSEVGTFDICNMDLGRELHHEWWKLVDANEKVLGYGWINNENDGFEISLAVHKNYQGSGLGSIIIQELESIAIEKGNKKIIAIVKHSNLNSIKMVNWLYQKGYIAYVPGMQEMQPVSLEFAIKIVKKMDIELIKYK